MVTPLPGPASATVTPASPTPIRSGEEVAVRILEAAPAIRPPARLSGEITETRPDGTVRIATDRGDILARLPDTVATRVGDTVTVDLPPPPQKGERTFSPTISSAERPTPSPAPSLPAANDPAATVPPRGTITSPPSADDTLRHIAQTTTAKAPGPLQPGQTIQIKAITAAQAQILLALGTQTIKATATTAVAPAVQTLDAPVPQGVQILPASALPSTGAPIIPSQTTITFIPFPDTGAALPAPAISAPGIFSPAPAQVPLTSGAMPLTEGSPQTLTLLSAAQMSVSSKPQLPLFPDVFAEHSLTFPLQPGGVFQAKLIAIGTPQFPQLPVPETPESLFGPSTVPQGHMFTVLGPAPQSQNVLQSAAQLFLLQTPSEPIKAATTLTVSTPVALAPQTQARPTIAGRPDWSALAFPLIDDLSDLMKTLPPEAAQNIFGAAGRLPLPAAQAPQQMGPALLFFLAAVRGDDFAGWMGERGMDALRQRGKGALIEKLEGAFSELRRAFTQAPAGDWKTFLFPMQFQQEMKPLLLHIHRDPGEKEKDEKKGGGQTRFVLDIGFDRLGPVQVDALYKPGQLDAILRSELAFSAAMREQIVARYANALAHGNLTGEIHFQNGLTGWVTVDPAAENMTVLA